MALFHEEIKTYILNNAEIHYKTFKETDFIILRDLSIRYDSLFYLVIHRESLCVLMMKKINSYDKFDHEIEFCMSYSHRCMTHFYGFVQNNDKITGFIYQFMCNGSLESYVNSNPEKINEIFCLTTINRITQAIMYLHSNSMIHRDIKPSNILLDQDFVPYLSDFDTIRPVDFDDSKKAEKNFTGNIGSFNYVSPEQYDSNNYSYPTDIYSLGLVIYFLFEKKHVLDDIKNNTFQATKCPFKINKICEQCIKINPLERPTINQVQEEVCNDIDSFNLFEQFLMFDDKKMILDFYHLIREFLVILNQENDLKKLEKFNDNIIYFHLLYLSKTNQGNSSLYLNLGNLYFYGVVVKQDYLIAKKYYELSAAEYDRFGILNLGNMYATGKGVDQDYKKALEYYMKIKENKYASFNIGFFYFNGLGVEQNFLLAQECYHSTLIKYESPYEMPEDLFPDQGYNYVNKFNNIYDPLAGVFESILPNPFEDIEYFSLIEDSNPFSIISNLYEDNDRFNQYHLKVNNHYVLPSKINDYGFEFHLRNPYKYGYKFTKINSTKDSKVVYRKKIREAIDLPDSEYAFIYGQGLLENYMNAKDNYKPSPNNNKKDIIYFLGKCYENGKYVKKNYSKAKEFYEISAKYNNAKSLTQLGDFYLFGYGVEKDFLKAKNLYEKAINQGNAKAYYRMGTLYLHGKGVKQDTQEAIRCFEIAANKDYIESFLFLGLIYFNGYYVSRNYMKAKEIYKKLSKKNNSHAFLMLGHLYFNGLGIKKNYLKAKKYFEKSAELNNYEAVNNIGFLYNYGFGVELNFEKAKEYYEKAARKDISAAFSNLGYLYENGYGVIKDYLRAKYYFEMAAESNNSTVFFNLGHLYYKGIGVEKNYLLARQYFEKSANLNNSYAYLCLGDLYFKGKGVKQNYLIAKKFYELSARYKNTIAFTKLGYLYYHGFGVEIDYFNARDYYQISSKSNYSESLFYLGEIYSIGDFFDIDIQKAIQYYLKCIEIEREQMHLSDYSTFESTFYSFKFNKYRYRSYNNVGLIYLILKEDIEKATDFVKQSAFAEFPFGQNNFGLLNQFYFNNIGNAKYMYERSAKHNFSLAEYNLGYLNEKNGNIKESIDFYIKASEHENEPLIFSKKKHFDKQLEISKIFIICLTNLKLVDYFLSISNFEESKKYFIKAFAKLELERYKFCFKLNLIGESNLKQVFSHLKTFIINCPLFNFSNQSEINLDRGMILKREEKTSHNDEKTNNIKAHEKQNLIEKENYSKNNNFSNKKQDENAFKFEQINDLKEKEFVKKISSSFDEFNDDEKKEKEKNSKDVVINENEIVFHKPGKLFDFVNENDELRNVLINEIKDILVIMNSILYTKPYIILFGRINIENSKRKKENVSTSCKNINQLFYEGFGFDLYSK
ncbi:hypothetical protein M9Y10_004115 [Tritrichomonas musculus]|uniref:Protein kinase domain-containing protein n=1 Tax=Tritrichomonas musculus TaxID=1915356 RepID=A0ABR2JRQ0_9EUKA